MIIVTATLSFETEADRDNAVASTAAVQKATRDDEEGCLAYCFGADPAEPTHVQVYELWTDPHGLAAHFDHPNYAKMVEVLHNCGGFLKSENRLYAADDRGPVYEDGKFRFDAVADTVTDPGR
jgi:quinol monooxygenase YgiN